MPALTPDKLFLELENKILKPVYYLCGEEDYRKNLAIDKIKQLINPDEFNFLSTSVSATNVSEILTTLNTAPVFSDKRLVIMRQAEKLKIPEKKDFIEYVKNPLETTCLIFESRQRKQTDILLKVCQDYGVKAVFYSMSQFQALNWLDSYAGDKNFTVTKDALKILTDTAGTDLTVLAGEMDKIFIYLAGTAIPVKTGIPKKKITAETVLASLGFSKEENPFELSAHLLNRDIKNALSLVEKLLVSGAEPLFLLSIVTNTVTKILKVKRMTRKGLGSGEIFAKAGLNKFFERDFISKAVNFKSEDALAGVIEKSVEIESVFKSSASADVKSSLKGILAKAISA